MPNVNQGKGIGGGSENTPQNPYGMLEGSKVKETKDTEESFFTENIGNEIEDFNNLANRQQGNGQSRQESFGDVEDDGKSSSTQQSKSQEFFSGVDRNPYLDSGQQKKNIDARKKLGLDPYRPVSLDQSGDTKFNQLPTGLKSDFVPKVTGINPDGDPFKTIKPTGLSRTGELKPPVTGSEVNDTEQKKESGTTAGDRKSSTDREKSKQAEEITEHQVRQEQETARIEQDAVGVDTKKADSGSRPDEFGTKNANDTQTDRAATVENQQNKSGAAYGSNAESSAVQKNVHGGEHVAGFDPGKQPSITQLRGSAQENAVKSDLSQYSPTGGEQLPGQRVDFQKGQIEPGLPSGVNGPQGKFANGDIQGSPSQLHKSEASAWQSQGGGRFENGSNQIPGNAVKGQDGKYYIPGQQTNLDGSKRIEVQEPAGKSSSSALVDNPDGSRVKQQEPTQSGSKSIEGTTRSGEVIDVRSEPDRGTKTGASKPGAKLEVEINSDGKGKRIGLDGKEIIGLDGKSSPLYPNQKGKRITRFVDQGKKIAPGRKPGGKSKFDPKADLDPKERAQIDKIIKETDRIFFGEKSPKAKGKSGQSIDGRDSRKGLKGESRGESSGKDGNKGHIDSKEIGSKGKLNTGDKTRSDVGSKSKGDVRSGVNSTKISKGDSASGSSKSDAGKSAKGKGFGLPDYSPFPGLKLPEFKIKWPGRKGKVGDAAGKSGKGQTGGKRGFDGVKSTGSGAGNRGLDGVKTGDKGAGKHSAETTKVGDRGTGKSRTDGTRVGDKGAGKTSVEAVKTGDRGGIKPGSSRSGRINFEANSKSLTDSISKLVSGSKQQVKLVRGLEVRSAEPLVGRLASDHGPSIFKPTKVSTGTRAHYDATFIPSSIAIQPVDWSGIRGWFETRGILRVNKGQKGTDRRPAGKTGGLGVRADGNIVKSDTATVKTGSGRKAGDTATVKTDSGKKAGDTATVKAGSGRKVGDTATVKTDSGKKAGDTATVKTDSGKKAGDTATVKTGSGKGDKATAKGDASKASREGDAASRKDKPEKKPESKKAENKKFELKESKDAYNGKLPSIKMTYKAESANVKSFSDKGNTKQSEIKPTKAGEKVAGVKPGADAVKAKDSEVAATNKNAGEIVKQIQKDLRPVNSAKAGTAHVEAMTPRSMKDMNVGRAQNEVDQKTGKTIKSEFDSAKSKPDYEKGKLLVEGKDGRLILKELAMTSGLKGGLSRRTDRLLDGAKLVNGAHIVSLHIGIQQAKSLSIREVLAGFNLGKAKKSFTPEISESGSYKVTRNQSSAQLKAFGSSARHTAINFSMEPSKDILSSEESALESEDTELDSEDQKNIYRKLNEPEDEARKPYIVQVGDTIDSIAVVELNDESLASLIFELNEPLFQDVFDIYKQEHVKTLRTGTMILLPNKSDIEKFKKA